jgi:DNA polymerase III epsilon subunit-like protein
MDIRTGAGESKQEAESRPNRRLPFPQLKTHAITGMLHVFFTANKRMFRCFGISSKSLGPRVQSLANLSQRLLSCDLHVPFPEKNLVKDLGAKWDGNTKKWYVPDHISLDQFDPWIREYLMVPFEQKDVVKQLGGVWDFHTKRWFVKGRKNLQNFNQWRVIFLQIPSNEIDQAIKLGAKSDKNGGIFIPYNCQHKHDFLRWLPRLYLHVPLSDEKIVKDQGAVWDNIIQKWYAYHGIASDEFLEKYFHPSSSLSSTEASKDVTPVTSSSTFKLLFFDVETNGLPRLTDSDDGSWKGNRYPPISDLSAYDTCRVVQLSYLICQFPSMEEISRHDSIIKCTDFTIENSHIHHITTEISLKDGVTFVSAIEEFMRACRNSDFLIAHNIQFDYHVISSELHRHQLADHLQEFQQIPRLCTMEISRNYLHETHNVTPSLKNLYETLTGEPIKEHHNSMSDVVHLHKAAKKMIELGILRLRGS